ncbi:MAG: sporulation protein YtfJ, partial [Clostridia bacterium]|nr:sporulation protein YtfJ [Clostridia bacterium]
MANNVEGLMGVSVDKIRELADANTVVGTPITTPDGTTLIPVSKVSYGFASGGSDLPSKTTAGL